MLQAPLFCGVPGCAQGSTQIVFTEEDADLLYREKGLLCPLLAYSIVTGPDDSLQSFGYFRGNRSSLRGIASMNMYSQVPEAIDHV